MAQYSPELIEQTLLVFKNRTGRVISEEDARQAVENICGFFRVLQGWADAEEKEGSVDTQDDPAMGNGVDQWTHHQLHFFHPKAGLHQIWEGRRKLLLKKYIT